MRHALNSLQCATTTFTRKDCSVAHERMTALADDRQAFIHLAMGITAAPRNVPNAVVRRHTPPRPAERSGGRGPHLSCHLELYPADTTRPLNPMMNADQDVRHPPRGIAFRFGDTWSSPPTQSGRPR